jgi:hypothetical protein
MNQYGPIEDQFMAAGWTQGIMDDLTTLNRRLTGVAGYTPITVDDYRAGLSDASQRLIRLNCLLLTAEGDLDGR